MSTGLLGAWSGVSSMSYTPNNASKVNIHYTPVNTANYARVNGINLNASTVNIDVTFWVGGGQTVVIDTVGGGNCIVSSLEG